MRFAIAVLAASAAFAQTTKVFQFTQNQNEQLAGDLAIGAQQAYLN
jgi:hypothetical protein